MCAREYGERRLAVAAVHGPFRSPLFYPPVPVRGMALMTASPVAWTPDPGGLRQVVVMLRDSACGSTAVQAQVYEELRSLAQHAEFNNYLAYILARGPADGRVVGAAAAASAEPRDAEAVGVRQAAGLLLKNNLKRLYNSLQPPVQAYINGELLSAIGDDSKLIRSAVAVCITAIVSEAGLRGVLNFTCAIPASFLYFFVVTLMNVCAMTANTFYCVCLRMPFVYCSHLVQLWGYWYFFFQYYIRLFPCCLVSSPAACVLFPSVFLRVLQSGLNSCRRSCAAWTRRRPSRMARCMRSPPFASNRHHGSGRTRPGRWTPSSLSFSTSSNTRRPLCGA